MKTTIRVFGYSIYCTKDIDDDVGLTTTIAAVKLELFKAVFVDVHLSHIQMKFKKVELSPSQQWKKLYVNVLDSW